MKNISDTAFLVAAYRAMESNRLDALFTDPFADKLVGKHGREIVENLSGGKRSSWFLVARTLIIDRTLLRLIQDEQIDTVLNLAAGLDTRAYRLPLPKELKWYDIDLPEISTHKEKTLEKEKPKCNYHLIKMNLADTQERNRFFNEIAKTSKKTLILSEGFLMYLSPSQATELSLELARHSSFRFWMAELIGPFQLKLIMWKWGKQFRAAHSEMKFAPENGPEFFRSLGWNPLQFQSSFDEAIKIGRAPKGAKALRAFANLLPFNCTERINRAGIVLLVR